MVFLFVFLCTGTCANFYAFFFNGRVMAMTVSLDKSFWGPKFWTILHTFAEHAGKFQDTVRKNDEANYWKQLLKYQGMVMPCAVCRSHFNSAFRSMNFSEFVSLGGVERRTWIRTWLWNLHNQVNAQNQKTGIAYEDLSKTYTMTTLKPHYQDLVAMFQRGTQSGQLLGEHVQMWKTTYQYLIALYGLI
jgi:hypothetical protein